MSVRLILSPNYRSDREKILNDIVEYALYSGNDAVPILRFFRKEEMKIQSRIKNSPLSAGVDYPRPVKKCTAQSGNYVVLYNYIPLNALTNKDVKQVNLNSLIPTATNTFNKMVSDISLADFNE